MRLIDADALLKEMDYHFRHLGRAEEVRNMINSLPTLESPRDWTPCAEGLPDTNDDVYITYEYRGKLIAAIGFMGRSGAWYILEDDEGNEAKVNAIAWQPLPDPYNPDHIRDATKKVDHIIDANKKVKEDAEC